LTAEPTEIQCLPEPLSVAEPPGGPEPGRQARGWLAREWFYVLLVLAALLMIAVSWLSPAPAVEPEAAALDSSAPNAMEIMARLEERPGLKLVLYGYAAGGLLIFLAGLPLLGYFLWQRMAGVPILGRHLPPASVAWGLWDVIKGGALYYHILTALGYLAAVLLPEEAASGLTLVIVLVGNLLITLFIFLLVARRDSRWRERLGLVAGGFRRRVRDGLVGYVAFFPLLMATALLAVLAAHLLNLEAEQNPLVPMVLGSDALWFLVFLMVFGGLVGPITEEIFFRGFFYPPLRRRAGRVGAILINAFCFAALHGNLVQLAPLIGLGLILALLRERTGSVLASIVLHCTHNTLVLILLLALKPVLL
jgi:membrane protease YdiL (CAAX protease family)